MDAEGTETYAPTGNENSKGEFNLEYVKWRIYNNLNYQTIMKKYLLVFMMMSLALTVGAHDIEVKNADDVTIYYNYINEGTELEVTFRGSSYTFGGYKGNVVIPEEVNYMNRILKVTSIGESAFRNCGSVISGGLTSVTIPNSVTSIGDNAFAVNNRLTSVTIGNSVTSIGDYAFEYCSRLTSVTIPNSVTSIGDHAFYGCTRMTSVTIPNSVTTIGDCAFYECKRLTSVTIPNSVTTIGDYAFEECSGLTSVTIGNSVCSIGAKAFYCENLATVVSLIENALTIDFAWKSSYFPPFSQNTFMNGTLYVPKGSKVLYEDNDWNNFRNIVEGTPTGITRVTSDKQTPNAPIYDLNGRRLTEPKKGINIIEGKKVLIK
jgi:hypothetical protein